MNPTSKKLISLFLIFFLVMLSMNLYAKERRGAKLIVTKKDGQQIRGELIAVKPNSLLLLDTEGKDVSVDIKDIEEIVIVKKSKLLLGAGIGLLFGAVIGALIGLSEGEDPVVRGVPPPLSVEDKVLGYGFYIGFSGGSLGGIAGAIAGKDKTIQIEGMPSATIKAYLKELRKKARIRDYR